MGAAGSADGLVIRGLAQHRVGALFCRCKTRAKGRALEVAALALHGPQVALHEHQFALADGVAGDAAHGAAFENVEVALAVLGFGRQGFRAFGVSDDQIGSGAGRHAAFFREDIEQPGGVGRSDGDEFAGRQPPGVQAFVPDNGQPFPDAATAVRNLGEIVSHRSRRPVPRASAMSRTGAGTQRKLPSCAG